MKGRGITLGAVVLIPFFVGGIVGYQLGAPGTVDGPEITERPLAFLREAGHDTHVAGGEEQDATADQISQSRQNAITRTVARVSPAVVGINVIELRQYRRWSPWGDDPFFRQFFGDRIYTQPVQSLGSGFLISSDGYILTNDHVAGNAKEITVTMTSGEKYEAELIGNDPVSDVALLKIKGSGLPHLTLGDSDEVIIGEWVIAFGNPFGLFDISEKPTVTVGVVSATNMNLRAQEGRVYRGMIQTDASINSGNSGGPLVNSLGEVIGVNSVIYTPNQGSVGVGFSIPINRVKAIVEELKKSGKIDRNFYTGLEIQNVDARVARYFGLDKVEGVIVSDVKDDSPADHGGFKPGDIILAVNGERVVDESDLISIVDVSRTDDLLRVSVWRNRRIVELTLKLERRPT
jgi:serine protease Do